MVNVLNPNVLAGVYTGLDSAPVQFCTRSATGLRKREWKERLFDLHLINLECEFARSAATRECQSGDVASVSLKVGKREGVLLPIGSGDEHFHGGHSLPSAFGGDSEGISLAVALGPEADRLLSRKVDTLVWRAAGSE